MPTPKAKSAKTTTNRVKASWSREDYLVDSLAQLETMAAAYAGVAAVAAKARALLVRAELDQLRETARKATLPLDRSAHKDEILAEVRRLRVGATEAGSYVAAASLLKQERELVALAEAEAAAAADKAMAHLDEAGILRLVLEALDQLPEEVLEQLAEEIRDRLS